MIAMSSGSGQGATVSTAFAKPLVALVTYNGKPAGGVSVTFTALASGASGKFGDGKNTETDMTNANGLATSSKFTADATAGGPYTVAATTSGAASSAKFSETNASGTKTYTFYMSGQEVKNASNNYSTRPEPNFLPSVHPEPIDRTADDKNTQALLRCGYIWGSLQPRIRILLITNYLRDDRNPSPR